MYRPVRIEEPDATPVSLEEVKAQLDISYTEKDKLLEGLIAAATAYLDGWTGILGRCLVEQTWRQDFDRFGRCLRLPLFPVRSVASVKYDDADGIEQTVAEASYSLQCDDLGYHVLFSDTYSFPVVAQQRPAVRVAYVCGHEDGDDVDPLPQAIKQAMLLLIRHWFDNPTAVVVGVTAQALPFAVEALLAPYRRMRV